MSSLEARPFSNTVRLLPVPRQSSRVPSAASAMTPCYLSFLLVLSSAHLLPYRSPSDLTASFYHDPPRLDCSSEGIQLYVKPIGNFSGHIYAKGFFFSDTCHSSFVNSPTSASVLLNIPYRGDCSVRRHHTSNPPAVSYEVTVVIQRHPLLVTAGDRAYRLNCVYRQLDTQVSQKINVDDLTTMPVQETSTGPLCHYDVLSQTLQGLPTRFANVGDNVIHRWKCDSDSHGFLVHSCVVRNEAGEEYKLVDDRGCVVDKDLIPDLVYNNDLSLVYTNIKAFKFADQVMVHFSCQITLCQKAEQGCEGIAPPICKPMELAPVPVEYRGTQDTTTADWQRVISETLQELNQPNTPSSPSSSVFSPPPQSTFSNSAVYASSESTQNYQEATTLPFDSSRWNLNGILETSKEKESFKETVVTERMLSTGKYEDDKQFGLEVVDASNIEKELGLPTSWTDTGKGYQTKMLSSPLQQLPEEDPLPFPATASVYYGNRRPRSQKDQKRLTVEVEAAEMAVFTNDNPVPSSPVASSSPPDRNPVVVAQGLNTLQTFILSFAIVSEVALLAVVVLQQYFHNRRIRRLKEKQGLTDY